MPKVIPVQAVEEQIERLQAEKELELNHQRRREIDIRIETLENLLYETGVRNE